MYMLLFFEEYPDSSYFNVYDTDDSTLEVVEDEQIFELYQRNPKLFPQLSSGIDEASDIWDCCYTEVEEVPNNRMFVMNKGVYSAKSDKFKLAWTNTNKKIVVVYGGRKNVLTIVDSELVVNGNPTGTLIPSGLLCMRTFGIVSDGSLQIDLGDDDGDLFVYKDGSIRISVDEFDNTVYYSKVV